MVFDLLIMLVGKRKLHVARNGLCVDLHVFVVALFAFGLLHFGIHLVKFIYRLLVDYWGLLFD